MLSLMSGDDIIINSIDLEEDNNGNVPCHQHTTTFPLQLVLKLDMLVEIYSYNYDSQDVLVNGADGVLKAYTKTKKIDVLWIKFHETHIGHQQANKLAYLYNSNTAHDWTPILRISKPISTSTKIGQLKIRKQFPIKLACACTIHRSQGLTLDSVAFDPIGIQIHGLVYTTLTRVRSIDSLYFLSALTKDNFKVKHKVDIEMQCLRTSTKWHLQYDYQSIQTNSFVSILTLNIRNLHAHMDDILNDYDTMQSDILCLQEKYMTLCMQNKQFPNHNCISSYTTHGVMILVKKHVTILEHMHFKENIVEMVLAKVIFHESKITILNLYAAPHATLSNILNVLSNALHHLHLNETIIILGDFNIDMLQNNSRTKELENYMCNYSLRFLLDKINHVQNTLIDHVWSNVPISQYIFILDTYWSDHDTISIVLEL
jgi:exonuclease III